jgi:hypothetical protein
VSFLLENNSHEGLKCLCGYTHYTSNCFQNPVAEVYQFGEFKSWNNLIVLLFLKIAFVILKVKLTDMTKKSNLIL